MNPEIKRCAYETCTTELPLDHPFPMCDPCRALTNRNTIAITQDPSSPVSDRIELITHKILTNLTAEEILRWQEKLESTYLQVCKTVATHNLKPAKLKVLRSEAEQVEHYRTIQERDTREKAARKVAKQFDRATIARNKKTQKLKDMGLDPSVLDTPIDF